ncbi:hypothetical protein PPUN110474_39720 [Pseudomonas putida]|nr:hypothetical protein PPUN110474_39720 [Pseudomonas putida]
MAVDMPTMPPPMMMKSYTALPHTQALPDWLTKARAGPGGIVLCKGAWAGARPAPCHYCPRWYSGLGKAT